jgi:hypothetical protein
MPSSRSVGRWRIRRRGTGKIEIGAMMAFKSGTYRQNHRSITGTLTVEEHRLFAALAAKHGKKPAPYATEILRAELAKQEQQCSPPNN